MGQEKPIDNEKIKFLVVDRDSRRFKKDKYVRGSGFEVERQKIDIADFDLVKYTELNQSTDNTTKP